MGFLFAIEARLVPVRVERRCGRGTTRGSTSATSSLPTFVLGIGLAAIFTRLLRGDLINTLQSDFIIMARAKGLPPRRILWRHALRASSFALHDQRRLQVGAHHRRRRRRRADLHAARHGLLLFESVQRKDLLVVQSVAALFALAVVMVNFVVDLLYAVVDPRIRHARAWGEAVSD